MRLPSTLIFISFLCLFSACKSGQKIPLEFNLDKGTEFTYRYTTDNIVDVKVMEQSQKTLTNQVFDIEYKVTDINTNGNTTMLTTYKNMKMNQDMSMMSIVYDSENPEKNTPPGSSDMYDALIGHQSSITFNKKGKMISMTGNDELLDKMIAKAPEGVSKEQMKAGLQSQFGEEAMDNTYGNLTNFYPDHPVKVKDTWTRKDTISGTIGMIMNINYTLTNRKAGKATISMDGTISPNLDAAGMELMGMKMKYNLGGTIKGEILVDEKTGWADKTEIIQDLKGDVQMSGELIGSMNTEMEMSVKTMIEKI